jgi:hypothetical protein
MELLFMIKRKKTRIVLPVLLLLVVSAGIFAENTTSIQTPVASEESEEKQQMIYDAVKEGVVAAGYKPGDTSNPSHSDRGIGNSYPLNLVSWYEAVRFCNKLSELDGLDAAYRISGTKVSCDWSKNGHRLPKEAEWEYAAYRRQLVLQRLRPSVGQSAHQLSGEPRPTPWFPSGPARSLGRGPEIP